MHSKLQSLKWLNEILVRPLIYLSFQLLPFYEATFFFFASVEIIFTNNKLRHDVQWRYDTVKTVVKTNFNAKLLMSPTVMFEMDLCLFVFRFQLINKILNIPDKYTPDRNNFSGKSVIDLGATMSCRWQASVQNLNRK